MAIRRWCVVRGMPLQITQSPPGHTDAAVQPRADEAGFARPVPTLLRCKIGCKLTRIGEF